MKFHKHVLSLQLILIGFLFVTKKTLSKDLNDIVIEKEKEEIPFVIKEDGFVVVYTDGACIRNGMDGAQAGIGIWFNHNHELNLSGKMRNSATNNNAEILAAAVAIDIAHRAGIRKLRIKTDSKFLINAITSWIKNWKRNDWKLKDGTPVKNKNAFILLDNALHLLESIDWVFVKSHNQEEGNEMADELARQGIFGKYIDVNI